jgi:hypothetical protein
MTHSSMILGVFSDQDNAEDAIDALKSAGYNPKDISIVAKDTAVSHDVAANTGGSVADGAVSGATTGTVLGALAGLLVGIGAVTIPGIGALFIAGPLATALGLTGAAASTVSGALTGALAGGLVGGLVGLGVPEDEAQVYEEQVRAGAILLAVPTRDGHAGEAREILEESGADKIRTVSMPHTAE